MTNRIPGFSGFSNNYLGVIWVSNDGTKATPLTGATGYPALTVWAEMFSHLALEPAQPVQPDTVRWDYFQVRRHRLLTNASCSEGALIFRQKPELDTFTGRTRTCGVVEAADWFDQCFRSLGDPLKELAHGSPY